MLGLGKCSSLFRSLSDESRVKADERDEKSRLHRYLFLLYRQTQPLLPLEEQSVVKSNERVDRRNFDVAAYVKENQLELVGANFFLVSPFPAAY